MTGSSNHRVTIGHDSPFLDYLLHTSVPRCDVTCMKPTDDDALCPHLFLPPSLSCVQRSNRSLVKKMTTSANCEKKIVKFNPRESALPHWTFKGAWPSPVPDSKKMDLYEKCAEDCSSELMGQIEDLPEGVKEFASFERVSKFHDLRKRLNDETDKDYEEKRKRNRLHFSPADNNDGGS